MTHHIVSPMTLRQKILVLLALAGVLLILVAGVVHVSAQGDYGLESIPAATTETGPAQVVAFEEMPPPPYMPDPGGNPVPLGHTWSG